VDTPHPALNNVVDSLKGIIRLYEEGLRDGNLPPAVAEKASRDLEFLRETIEGLADPASRARALAGLRGRLGPSDHPFSGAAVRDPVALEVLEEKLFAAVLEASAALAQD